MARVVILPGILTVVLSLSLAAWAGTPLKVDLDKARVDLAARKLELKLNKPEGRVEVKVFGTNDNAPLVEYVQDFKGHPTGEPLTVTWPDPGAEVARIDLRAYDNDNYHVGFALIPWSAHIPHEEVNFATDSAVITAGEAPKLEASLKLINEAVAKQKAHEPLRQFTARLFIAGHTDSVGNPGHNLKLSQRRAQAIASWFRKRGLRTPLYFEGFGEHALLVQTPDQTDEPRNRRVDYILGVEEPPLKATGFRPSWKAIP